jgi:tripartite-type tricarboxylate transporter receptor subunit TctC
LFVQGATRIPAFPTIPTVKEALGVDHLGGAWRAVVGPKGMPPEVTAKLAAAVEKIWKSAEFRDFMNSRGFGPRLEGGQRVHELPRDRLQPDRRGREGRRARQEAVTKRRVA